MDRAAPKAQERLGLEGPAGGGYAGTYMADVRVALVTGASRGIGAAVAHRLAQGGAAVLACGRDRERTEEVCAAIEGLGGLAWPIVLDVSEPEALRATCEEARGIAAEVGPVAWLVNNAGIAVSAPLLGGDGRSADELVERHMSVNFHGARRVMEALLSDMLERGYGRIVNVASSAGLQGYPYVSAYCASKHALVGYSRAAALELEKKGVTVNLVCPHYVDSPMTDESVRRVARKTGREEAEARAFFASQNPGGRLVRAEEVAEVAQRLLECDATGQLVELDGSDSWRRQLSRAAGAR